MAKKLSQKETEKLIGGIREAYEAKIRQLNYRLDSLNVENSMGDISVTFG